MLVLLGCGEMLFAIIKRKAALAQKSMIKLEFSLLRSVIGSFFVNRWPYLVYKFWLKFVMVLEIFLFSAETVSGIQHMWRFPSMKALIEPIPMLITCSLTAFCCYEMEVVLRTNLLTKSQKAIFRLKLCILVSIITAGIVEVNEKKLDSPSQLGAMFVVFSLPPAITLIGALFTNKIIEQRDCLAKFSSYSGENYL